MLLSYNQGHVYLAGRVVAGTEPGTAKVIMGDTGLQNRYGVFLVDEFGAIHYGVMSLIVGFRCNTMH